MIWMDLFHGTSGCMDHSYIMFMTLGYDIHHVLRSHFFRKGYCALLDGYHLI
uniref:Uncharacterized protein n=1 Tax=Lepeophtheirus salmonis TaxID=72036 RepID=A0A0K2SY82_LEPSM